MLIYLISNSFKLIGLCIYLLNQSVYILFSPLLFYHFISFP